MAYDTRERAAARARTAAWRLAHPNYNKQYRAAHRAQITVSTKKWRAEHRKQVAAYARKSYQTHREKRSASQKRYREEHSEQIAASEKKWRKEHPDLVAVYGKKYRQTHREELSALGKQYYAAHRAQISSRMKKWRESNPERFLAQQRKYLRTHSEAKKISSAKYERLHPDVGRVKTSRRRAAKHGAPINSFTAKEWTAMKLVYGGACAYCQTETRLTQDHVVPLSKGGNHCASNIVPACKSCNSKKGTKDAESFRSVAFDIFQEAA